jgi:hypothetical protein
MRYPPGGKGALAAKKMKMDLTKYINNDFFRLLFSKMKNIQIHIYLISITL